MSRLAPLMSSKKMDWPTPTVLARRIEKFLDGIDLDPCAGRKSPVRARRKYYRNGLEQSWRGAIFVNPPYGREIGKWVDRCRSCDAREVIALVPSRTDTAWWHRSQFNTACLIRGRLTFVGAKHAAPFPSALLYWGPRVSEFRAAFATLGMMVAADFQLEMNT